MKSSTAVPFIFIISAFVFTEKVNLQMLKAEESRTASDFELSDLNGKKIKLSNYRESIIVINFWETWCPVCIKEMPSLNRLVDNYKKEKKVVFWAISHEDKLSIQEFLSKYKFNYQQFYNGLKVRKAYNVQFVPVHMIIDPKGKIRYSFPAEDEVYDKLNKGIKSLLKELKEN
ncbi:MAG: alkyl hydroperoxide reductase [candidate division Zixibacteria bacterium RBG-1]|nr:MAG: alkyl hydroperoxide reductase [candidate division Zixibacteria bacterium RBG-1]OGC85412.1 MAG: hypothetical protein A2V73_08850 [candidate division Zixibacteria bacterium RBG_19FT_COMBO_42_43]